MSPKNLKEQHRKNERRLQVQKMIFPKPDFTPEQPKAKNPLENILAEVQ